MAKPIRGKPIILKRGQRRLPRKIARKIEKARWIDKGLKPPSKEKEGVEWYMGRAFMPTSRWKKAKGKYLRRRAFYETRNRR